MFQHMSFHRHIHGFRRRIADDGGLLGEMSQLPGIICQLNLEMFTTGNITFRIFCSHTVAVGLHLTDAQFLATFVTTLEDCRNRMLIACSPDIDGGLLNNQFLCSHRERRQQEQRGYDQFSFHHSFTLKVIDGAVARYSGA